MIGSIADLRRASVPGLRSFFAARYSASNASLVLVGDFQSADARLLVERTLGRLPARPVPARPVPAPVHLRAPVVSTVRDHVALERSTLAWHAPPAFSEDHVDVEVLAALLGQGKGARLVRALVYEQLLAESVEVRYEPMAAGGHLVIEATAQPDRRASQLEEAIAFELERLRSAPPTAEEVTRACALVESDRLAALGSLEDLAATLQGLELFGQDSRRLEEIWIAPLRRVTPATVAKVGARIFGAPAALIRTLPRG